MSFLTSTPTRTCTSEAADKTLKFKAGLTKAEKSKPWIVVNVVFTLVLTLDVVLGSWLLQLLAAGPFFQFWLLGEKTALIVFCFNSLFLIFTTLKPLLFTDVANFRLTARQIQLLGVSKDESRLLDKSSALQKSSVSVKKSKIDQSSLDLSWLFRLRDRSALDYSTYSVSPLDASSRPDQGGFISNESYAERLARMRRARSCSPFVSPNRSISNHKHLKDYLRRFKDRNVSLADSSIDEDTSPIDLKRRDFSVLSVSSTSTYFDDSRLNLDVSAPPNMIADRSSQSISSLRLTTTPDFSHLANHKYCVSPVVKIDDCLVSSGGSIKTGESPTEANQPSGVTDISTAESTIWLKYDVDPAKLDVIVHNCRVWLARTIFKPLAVEIDTLNATLARATHHNYHPTSVRIGQSSLVALRQAALTGADQWPTLAAMLPYLQVTDDQALLVDRVKSLSHGSCLASYDPHKPAGDRRIGAQWSDFDVVLHFVRVYLAGRCSPPDPTKVFDDDGLRSSRYFRLQPTSTVLKSAESSDTACRMPVICRPGPEPRVFVQYGGRALDVCGLGASALFKTLSLFWRIVQMDLNGRLDGISLGPSGLNVEWIFD